MSKKIEKAEKEAPAAESQLAANKSEDVKLSEQDKINFFKSFLADEPFIDTLSSLGGALRLKFKSLTSVENMDIYSELKKAQNDGELSSDANYITQLTCSRISLTLVSINDEEFAPDITPDKYPLKGDTDSYVVRRTNIVKSWSVHKLTTIGESFKVFENKLMALIKEVQTENFWPAGE